MILRCLSQPKLLLSLFPVLVPVCEKTEVILNMLWNCFLHLMMWFYNNIGHISFVPISLDLLAAFDTCWPHSALLLQPFLVLGFHGCVQVQMCAINVEFVGKWLSVMLMFSLALLIKSWIGYLGQYVENKNDDLWVSRKIEIALFLACDLFWRDLCTGQITGLFGTLPQSGGKERVKWRVFLSQPNLFYRVFEG